MVNVGKHALQKVFGKLHVRLYRISSNRVTGAMSDRFVSEGWDSSSREDWVAGPSMERVYASHIYLGQLQLPVPAGARGISPKSKGILRIPLRISLVQD